MEVDQELFAIFRAEVEEQIEDLCDKLERSPERWRIDRLFQISHNVKGAAKIVGVASIQFTAHALEDLFAAVRDGRTLDESGVNLARVGADHLSSSFHAMESKTEVDVSSYRPDVDGWLKTESEESNEDKGPQSPEAAPGPQSGDIPSGSTPTSAPTSETGSSREHTIRVATDKVDALMGLASEFVSLVFRTERHGTLTRRLAGQLLKIQQSRPELKTDPEVREALRAGRALLRELVDHANDSLAISEELQNSVRSLRMVRIDGLRPLLNRSIRDASQATGRNASLTIVGGDTEVDRAILEQLRDPLIHLVRNAVGHGIEDPDVRAAAGKPGTGRLELIARTSGPWVEVLLRDDGRGVDVKQVRGRAVEKQIVTHDELEASTDDEVLDLLFEAGLSTADEVTELAGRGVGLDVVRSRMVRLGGRSTLTSKPGAGTEVTLRVPLTRLTTNGILVRVGRQTFALPTGEVERTLSIGPEDVFLADGAEVIRISDRLVRIVPLAEIIGVSADEAAQKPAVVITDGMRRRALLVDKVLGQREYIVQPLAWNLDGAPLVSGTTVVDGGSVVPVLNSRVLMGSVSKSGGWTMGREIRQFRLLVVDDSATSRTLERNILKTAGYDVLTAVNGEEALQILKSEDIDLVVSDVEMPVIDGFDLTRRIRGNAAFEQTPVILVTSLGSEEDKAKGAEAGADAYIVKGAFDQDELLKTVGRLL
jgi:two-component system chemotaxis sensor kinase CheA